MFADDFVATLRHWKGKGERLMVGLDMNDHVLRGQLAVRLRDELGLIEVTASHWGKVEPNTHIDGTDPIDTWWVSDDIEVTGVKMLSFHQSVGDHRTILIEASTRSMIGEDRFKVVRPQARRLSTSNRKAFRKYNVMLESKVEEHKLESRLERLAGLCVQYPVAEDVQKELEVLDQQTKELQVHCERKCRHIYRPELEFSGPVQEWNFRRRCYSDLLRRHTVGVNNMSNIVRRCHRAGIEDPKQLTAEQCREGKRYCRMRMREFKKDSPWMRKQLLEARKQIARAEGRQDDCAGIARVQQREKNVSTWIPINRAVDDPRLGAIRQIHKKEGGRMITVRDKEGMEREIQTVGEHRFDLAHSAPISMSSLIEKMGYLSDTEFARAFLKGEEEVPADVDGKTTLILEEIARLGMSLEPFGEERLELTPEKFRECWRRATERTSSSISTVHFGHYRSAAKSEKLTAFLSKKITVSVRCGCPPDRWGNGLQVMLEKIAGVFLAERLRMILLMEADHNQFNG